MAADGGEVGLRDGDDLERDREERELDVAHPERRRALVEHELEVAARKPRERGGGERGADPDERAVALGRLLGLGVLALHEDDAEGEQEEGEPLAPAEALAEEDDREERGGDGLRLSLIHI